MSDIIFSENIPGVFAEETLYKKDFSMPGRHFHESIELYFMLEGERYYFIEQDTYHVKPGMAVLINKNQIHKTNMVSGSNGHRRFLLQLDDRKLDRFFSLPDFPSIWDFGKNYWGIAEFSPLQWQQVLSAIGNLKSEMLKKDREGNCLGLLTVMRLVTLFVQCRKMNEIAQRKKSFASHQVHTGMYLKVHEIALYLQNNSASPCSLDAIAAHFYISRPYLTRIFKSVTGFTVTEYLTVCRIRKAKALLSNTSLNITDIAAQTGFGNITYFERVFKQTMGCTPLQYRKCMRKRI